MTSREFAIEVVLKLQNAGFQALWAGGCVRDQMLGREPKDYDVATNATPDQVRDVFGHRRTLPIGASFGVITVLGPRQKRDVLSNGSPTGEKTTEQHVIEIATFRRDGGYTDGRRPDSVEFTDAREDALRRDFTINGMFFDPIVEQVHDYVGGQEDLAKQQIRAIGNPEERIEEDKLRMLRGIRFASTFEFALDRKTLDAIKKHAAEIRVVSGERIGAEMRRMLASPSRASAVELLRESGLLIEILESGELLFENEQAWEQMLERLRKLKPDEFETAAVILLAPIVEREGMGGVFEQWKLSNDERKSIEWICKHWRVLNQADQLPWSRVQPLLLNSDASRALAIAAVAADSPGQGIEFCRERLNWPVGELNPNPLLNGRDLIRIGIERGPNFRLILDEVRRAQLDGEIRSVAEAETAARNCTF